MCSTLVAISLQSIGLKDSLKLGGKLIKGDTRLVALVSMQGSLDRALSLDGIIHVVSQVLCDIYHQGVRQHQ